MNCPICKKATQQIYRPFCSKRCADIDLGKWLNEEYTMPADADEAPTETIENPDTKDFPLH